MVVMCMSIDSSATRSKTCFLACNLLCSKDWIDATNQENRSKLEQIKTDKTTGINLRYMFRSTGMTGISTIIVPDRFTTVFLLVHK